jgi:hypothetical protein
LISKVWEITLRAICVKHDNVPRALELGRAKPRQTAGAGGIQRMNFDFRKALSTAVKLLLACLLVGWILSVVEIDPLGFIRFISRSVREAADIAADAVRWAFPYVTLGAIIVIPVYVIRLGLDLLKKRRSKE